MSKPSTSSRKISADDFSSPARWPGLFVKIFQSYWLATGTLFLMTLITLFGTYYQVDYGLKAAEDKYFHSLFLVHQLDLGKGTLPLPLPGGLLLMSLLTVNLIVGAIIKVKKRSAGIGMLIAHGGMIMLLLGSLLTHAVAVDGNMALFEGESADKFQSYHEWQLEVIPVNDDGTAETAWVIPDDEFEHLDPDESRTFSNAEIPFSISLTGYRKNSVPVVSTAPVVNMPQFSARRSDEVGGYVLLGLEPEIEAERNLAGMVATFGGASDETAKAILWADSSDGRAVPFTVKSTEGKKYAVQLRRKTWQVPFTVRLEDFRKEDHAGLSMARAFDSTITKIENGVEEQIEIKMNEPLRHKGYTFFQASWGPPDAQPGAKLYSVFAVKKDPGDQWPLWSLVVTTIGLVLHFVLKFSKFLDRETRAQKRKAEAAAA